MPKENYTIATFHGGLNNASDPRDIRNEDLSAATGIDVSRVGKIEMMKHQMDWKVHGPENIGEASLQPGHGLFYFRTDATGVSSQTLDYIYFEEIQIGSPGSKATYYIDIDSNSQANSSSGEGAVSITAKVFFNFSGASIEISDDFIIQPDTTNFELKSMIADAINAIDTSGVDSAGMNFTAEHGTKNYGSGFCNILAAVVGPDGNGNLSVIATNSAYQKWITAISVIQSNVGLSAQPKIIDVHFTAIGSIDYFIDLHFGASLHEKYKLTGHATNDIIGMIQKEFMDSAVASIYKDGVAASFSSSRALERNGIADTNGINGNSNYTCVLNVTPNDANNDTYSLLTEYDFGMGGTAWAESGFTFSGSPGSPIATFDNSGDGYLKQDGAVIDANQLYQITFTTAVANLELTFKDYANSNVYVPEATYSAGTHIIWFFQTSARSGLYINCEDDGSGVGTITDIKLQTVTDSIRITGASNINFSAMAYVDDTGALEKYVGNRWIGIVDSESNLYSYSHSAEIWSSPVSLGTGENCKAAYYYTDGALRISDGNYDEDDSGVQFNANNTPQWYGFVDRYFYGTSSAGYTDGGNEARSAFLTRSFVSADAALKALTIKDIAINGSPTAPDATDKVSMKFESALDADNSTWAIGDVVNYDVAVTTLYDDSKQESALDDSGEYVIVPAGHKVRLEFGVWGDFSVTTAVHTANKRVSGFHIYMRENGKTDWFLQWEVDIEKGVRAFKTGDWAAWGANDVDWGGDGLTPFCLSAYLLDPRGIETYEIMTGHDQAYTSVSLDTSGNGFKSAIVANRRAWIAAPSMQDELGNTVTLGDTMIKSNVNQFDSFTLDNRVDVAIRDGEDIIAIAEFGDRILQFKHQTLYIINIAQDFEFLEGTYKYKGILSPAAQCKTDYGIAWINKSGCFLYDGKQIRNLLEKNGIDVIKDSVWSDFITAESMIGYSPNEKQLVILKRFVHSGDDIVNDVFVFNLVIGSWTRGTNKWPGASNKSNFLTDWNGNLVLADAPGSIKEWGSDSSHTEQEIDIATRDIDLGKPANRKKVYKIYITYKCSAASTNVQVEYYINGDVTTSYNFKPISNATLSGSISVLDGGKDDWTFAELKPENLSDANNIYSIKVRLFNVVSASTRVPKEFEVNDISIIHRRKSIK